MASGVKTSDAIAVKQNESWAAYTRLSSQEATIASQGRLSGTCRADPLVMAVAGGVCTLRRLAVQRREVWSVRGWGRGRRRESRRRDLTSPGGFHHNSVGTIGVWCFFDPWEHSSKDPGNCIPRVHKMIFKHLTTGRFSRCQLSW